MFAAALGFRVAPNDAFQSLCNFYFEPLAAAAFFITTISVLADDAFQPSLTSYFKKGFAVLRIMI